ncbi:MAG: alanine racemase [Deltaproteobacteria bacterium]|nr:alanine racemase [Deltaproteobacteria bacterium]
MRLQRVVAEVQLAAIRKNLELLVRTAGAKHVQGAAAMVKCNAYGHGLLEVARELERARQTLALGVASLEEGAALRAGGVRKPIWVFSGAAPYDDVTQDAVKRFGLTPVVHNLADLKRLLAVRRRPDFHLKFNTGMNRLGLEMADIGLVRGMLERARARPQGICTHFASAEEGQAPITRDQISRFREVAAEFSAFSISHIHCSNTAASMGAGTLQLDELCNVIRPGLGLYGYGGTGLKPALKLRARVLWTRALRSGEVVGYGGTYRTSSHLEQSVLALGYGDGFLRRLSNCRLIVGGKRVEVLGRVSMDLMSLGMKAKPGSWVTLLGDDQEQGTHMAEAAGTIIYEILTSISARVPRVHRRAR